MPKREYRYWTTGEIKTLREMVLAGKSRREIAKTLGRSVPVINNKVQKLGGDIPRRKSPRQWSAADLQTLTDMARQGYNIKDISAALNRCETNCQKKLRSIFGPRPLHRARNSKDGAPA